MQDYRVFVKHVEGFLSGDDSTQINFDVSKKLIQHEKA